MIKIGKVSNSVINVNGRKLGVENLDRQIFDEVKKENSSGVSRVVIKSDIADVNVNFSESADEIEVRLQGDVLADGVIRFSVDKHGNSVQVVLKNEGDITSECDLKLDVMIPEKVYERLEVRTLVANVFIAREIRVKELEVRVTSGEINSGATFARGVFRVTNGSVRLYVVAKENLFIDIKNMNGSVSMELKDVANRTVYNNIKNGSYRNRHICSASGYNADIHVELLNGIVYVE